MSKAAAEVAEAGLSALLHTGRLGALSDGELLRYCHADRFDIEDAERAFHVIVARHGRMVFRVCRAILNDHNSADDAFQATFLVLWRKAPRLDSRDSVGPWLHGVASRISRKARVAAARRNRHETATATLRVVEPADPIDEVTALVHEELGRLPDKYRMPVVLCHLQGLTHEDAAKSLQWPVGTVRGRLSRARELLRDRLVRRGFAPLAAGLGLTAFNSARADHLPVALIDRTWKGLSIGGAKSAAGVVSEAVMSLVRQELHGMLAAKFKIGGAVLLAGVLAAGVSTLAQTPARRSETKTATKTVDKAPAAKSDAPKKTDGRARALADLSINTELASLKDLDSIKELVSVAVGGDTDEQMILMLRKRKAATIRLMEECNYGIPKSLKDADKSSDSVKYEEVFEGLAQTLSEIESQLVDLYAERLLVKIAEKKLIHALEPVLGKEEVESLLRSSRVDAGDLAAPTRIDEPYIDQSQRRNDPLVAPSSAEEYPVKRREDVVPRRNEPNRRSLPPSVDTLSPATVEPPQPMNNPVRESVPSTTRGTDSSELPSPNVPQPRRFDNAELSPQPAVVSPVQDTPAPEVRNIITPTPNGKYTERLAEPTISDEEVLPPPRRMPSRNQEERLSEMERKIERILRILEVTDRPATLPPSPATVPAPNSSN